RLRYVAVREVITALASSDLAVALARLPFDAGGRAHQAARRSLLARPHVHGLPLRDAAEPESALLVPSPGPDVVPQARGAVQPPRGARRPVLRLRSAAATPGGGRARRGLPGPADPERQSLVPQLAHDRGGGGLLRRRRLRAAAALFAAGTPRTPRGRSRGDEGA